MTKDEALKLALEALEKSHICPLLPDDCSEAITAIKEALAQPEQEPVAWRYKILDYFGRPVWTLKTPKTDIRVLESQPLYTTQPQRKPLTAMEVYDVVHDADLDWHTGFALGEDENRFVVFARAIEAAHGIKGEA